MKLENRVAIVTGGGTGIGLGIAEVLVEHGARVVLAQRRLDLAEKAARGFRPGEALPFALDIRDPELVERMVEATLRNFGRLDILVNNASVTGMPAIAPLLSSGPSKVDDIVDVNVKGTFYCSQSAAKRMIESGEGGSIVNISSVGAFAAQEFASLYCATKAAQVALTKAMALELAPHKIRVNCVAPGDIETEASATITGEKSAIGAKTDYVRMTPLGTRGSPRDIGHAVAYLASQDAGFVTGATLLVDGGFLTY